MGARNEEFTAGYRSEDECYPLAAEAAALALADAVTEAGNLALAMFRSGLRTWTKENTSPVTDADLAADELLRRHLGVLAPDYGWLSEETADAPKRLGCRRVWVVDPIDGTRSFMQGLPDWAVSAALVENGRPVAAALYAPASQELFVAAAGQGTTRNGTLIVASETNSLRAARIAGSRSMVERLAQARVPVVVMPRIHSLALRLARVATGEVDASLAASRSHDWDLAAADLIVHEARGRLTSFDGATPVYNRPQPEHGALVAAGAGLHPALLATLGETAGKTASPNRNTAMGIAEP